MASTSNSLSSSDLDYSKIRKIKTDVVPVVVQDADTQQVLILAFANKEAVDYSLKHKIATFWSTSRNELWVKGATSGNFLELVDMRVNCEDNSLLYLVRAKGKNACHTGRPSCFYRPLLLLLLMALPIHATDVEKHKTELAIGVRTYNISSSEQITLYGAKQRRYLTPDWYWGEAGYGAVSGIRSGYLEGGIQFGYQNLSVMVGAGGGGSAPQGGGLVIHPSITIGPFEAGYVHFINGNISSPSVAFNVSLPFWELAAPLSGATLNSEEIQKLEKQRVVQHILYENYLQTDQGLASVFGYHFDLFLTDHAYLATAIFGAVGGNRGGYGIAAFGLGYSQPITHSLSLDSKLLLGSGGGGGVKAGGGFSVEGQTGLSWEFMPHLFLDSKVGYLTFPSGTFSSPIFQVGFSFESFRINLPY